MENTTFELKECGGIRSVVAQTPGAEVVCVQRVPPSRDDPETYPGKVEIFIGEGPTIRMLVMTLVEGARLQEAFARLG